MLALHMQVVHLLASRQGMVVVEVVLAVVGEDMPTLSVQKGAMIYCANIGNSSGHCFMEERRVVFCLGSMQTKKRHISKTSG